MAEKVLQKIGGTSGHGTFEVVDIDGAVNVELNGGTGLPRVPVVNITADATRTITAAECGTTFLMNKADGIVFTLPAASVGLWYEFQANTSVTSNSYKLSTATQGTEFFVGTLPLVVGGTADVDYFAGNGSTHDNITFAGTTTGGLAGTRIRVQCISSTLWSVSGFVVSSGTSATPFATS